MSVFAGFGHLGGQLNVFTIFLHPFPPIPPPFLLLDRGVKWVIEGHPEWVIRGPAISIAKHGTAQHSTA